MLKKYLSGFTDCHCHIIPGIDDGASDAGVSYDIASELCKLGFSRVIATPHFYFYKESVNSFLDRRGKALEQLGGLEDIILIPAAEVALEPGFSDCKGLEKLAIPGTEYLLVELPMRKYSPRIGEELYDLRIKTGLKPLFAHIERYIDIFSSDDYDEIMSIDDAAFQFSLFAVTGFRLNRFFSRFYKSGAVITVGTDAHKLDFRIADSEKGIKKLSKTVSDSDFERIMSCAALGLN